jgi:hypothetical protein
MFNSHVLEVIAGLSFIFFVVSVFVSAVNEWIAAVLGLRAKDLETGLKNLLSENLQSAAVPPAASSPAGSSAAASPAASPFGMATALLTHPLVENVSPIQLLQKKVTGPSYLAASVFSTALIDLLLPAEGERSIAGLRRSVSGLENTDLRNALLPLIDRAGDSMDRARRNMEAWYDHAMEHVSGRYKRRAQAIMLLLGLAFAAALNVNTLSATTRLWNDPVLREHIRYQEQSVGATSNACAGAGSDRSKLKCSAQLVADAYSEAAMPIGWSEEAVHLWDRTPTALTVVLGWFLTALAACLGAPFWFDLLNKTLGLNARLTGARPDAAAERLEPTSESAARS